MSVPRLLRSLPLALTAVLVATFLVAGPAQAGGPGDDGRPGHHGRHGHPGHHGHHHRGANWYVAVGDSLTTGYQPGVGNDLDGGFVGGVYTSAKKSWRHLRLQNVGCAGATTASLLTGTNSACTYPEGSQIAAAESFLKKHRGKVRLVTVTIGANDVQKCVNGDLTVDFPCLSDGMAAVQQNMPQIVKRLRAAAPQARIVVGHYYNPFLAAWLAGDSGQSLAQLSTSLLAQLNANIDSGANAGRAKVALVDEQFKSTDWTIVSAPGLGDVPTNVATICAWTWMCSKADIHANDTGYAQMAIAFRRAAGLH